jgi:hypothetical protein
MKAAEQRAAAPDIRAGLADIPATYSNFLEFNPPLSEDEEMVWMFGPPAKWIRRTIRHGWTPAKPRYISVWRTALCWSGPRPAVFPRTGLVEVFAWHIASVPSS